MIADTTDSGAAMDVLCETSAGGHKKQVQERVRVPPSGIVGEGRTGTQ